MRPRHATPMHRLGFWLVPAARLAPLVVTALVGLACGSDDAAPPTSQAATSSVGAGGSSAGGSGGATSSTASTGGGAQAHCWNSDVQSWSVEPFDMTMLAGLDHDRPSISADGLTLYYSAKDDPTAPHRVWSTSRASRSDPFRGGQKVANWPSEPHSVVNPYILGDELFFAIDDGAGYFEVGVSVFSDGLWGAPTPLAAPINSDGSDRWPMVTSDGRRLLFEHTVVGGGLGAFELHEAARSDNTPGTPFSTSILVEIPPIVAEDVMACGALSPDGRRIFFATSHGTDISNGLPPGAGRIWYATRATVDDAWQPAEPIAAFDDPDGQACPNSVTADGCELWFEHFWTPDPATLVATRQPPP